MRKYHLYIQTDLQTYIRVYKTCIHNFMYVYIYMCSYIYINRYVYRVRNTIFKSCQQGTFAKRALHKYRMT